MKRILILFYLTLSLSAAAQRTKYKDMVVTLPYMSVDQQKNELKEFIVEELDHPNANFRLALLYEQNYRSADPLTAFAYAIANAEQTKIRYLKSKQTVDEREVNRNMEYYWPLFKMYDTKGKPTVPFATVSAKITGGYDSATLFIEKMPAIYERFTKSVNFYDQAVKTFAQISNAYSSHEDLYLMYDQRMDEQFTQLKSNYDSCVLSLDEYLKLTKIYPVKGHNQTYTVKPIETYHLDGLITSLSFLTNTIELWDYSSWVDRVRKKVNTEVDDLRKRIIKTNEQFDEALAKISSSPASQLPPLAKMEKQVAFNLNNLDRQSMILALMEYKSFKQQWEIESRSKELDTTSSDRNAAIYSSLIYANRKSDTLIKDFKNRITPLTTNRHAAFVTRFYGGQAGLEKYAATEEQHIRSTFDHYTNELRANIANHVNLDEVYTNKDNLVKSGRFQIPLTLQPLAAETLDQGLLVTQFNRKNPDRSAYIAGVYKPDKKKNTVSTYVVRVNPDGKVAWLKDFPISVDSAVAGDANAYLGPFVLTQEGCAFIVRSIHTTRGDAANTFIYLNEKGEEKLKIRLKENLFPRFLLYSEKGNAFIITLKGVEEKQQFATSENIATLSLNALGQVIWKRDVQLTGTVTDLISLVDGYMLAGNFLVMQDQHGKEIRTKVSSAECSPFMIKLGERGELLQSMPVLTPYSVYLSRVVKINDNSINLLGYAEKIDLALDKKFTSSGKMIHIMSNWKAEIVYANY